MLAAAEQEFKGEIGIHYQMFKRKMQAAISFDRQMNNPGILGQNLDRSHEKRQWEKLGPRVIHVGLGPTTYTG